jgi:class 3 adenylate cyclase
MDELPSGTVTLLFTDIERLTRHLQNLGRERYVRALTTHRQLLRSAFGRHGGVEVEMQGDSSHFAFRTARDAVAAAAAGQRALETHDLRDLATRRLKDLPRPERLYQLVVDGLQSDFPPLRTLDVETAAKRQARRRTLLAVNAKLIGFPRFFSKRMGCHFDHPAYFVDFAALCIRRG